MRAVTASTGGGGRGRWAAEAGRPAHRAVTTVNPMGNPRDRIAQGHARPRLDLVPAHLHRQGRPPPSRLRDQTHWHGGWTRESVRGVMPGRRPSSPAVVAGRGDLGTGCAVDPLARPGVL